jgi:hypothetical protein
MRVEQRPWIKIAAEGGSLKPDSPYTGKIHLENSGKTPAKNMRVDFSIDEMDSGDEPRLDYPTPHYIGTTGIVYPNTTVDFDISMYEPGHMDGAFHKLSQPEIDMLLQHKRYLVIYGKAGYTDFFKVNHWTHMCQFVIVHSQQIGTITYTVNAKACTDYGDTDNN